ncbi:MAG: undecaprenyl-phosphate glucose phosphotransferase [Alphaproteobacteria bacterium]|nr:undecaprenyl-phosphate glucose phosphotransferase [Alphaproteobacteria bacterium]
MALRPDVIGVATEAGVRPVARAQLRWSGSPVAKAAVANGVAVSGRVSEVMAAGVLRAADIGAICIASWLASSFCREALSVPLAARDGDGLTALCIGLAFVCLGDRIGEYRTAGVGAVGRRTRSMLALWTALVAALICAAMATGAAQAYSRAWVVAALVAAPALMGVARTAAAILSRAAGHRLVRRVAIVGTGSAAADFLRRGAAAADGPIEIVGVFEDAIGAIGAIEGVPVRGNLQDLITLARRERIDEIVIALPLGRAERIAKAVARLRVLPVDVRLALGTLNMTVPSSGMSWIGAAPVLHLAEKPLKDWGAVAKWIEDKVLAVLLLALLAPLMAAIAIWIKLDSPGPVLFGQARFGFNNRAIKVWKFRTMFVDRGDPSGGVQTLRDDPRVTRAGRLLRRLSLDELPQLFNVLLGDMSLVGPRAHALTMQAAGKLYHEAVAHYFERHRVNPGITGWAQVNGLRGETRSLASAEARVRYDLDYIDRWSLLLDFKIILLSFRAVLSGNNAY